MTTQTRWSLQSSSPTAMQVSFGEYSVDTAAREVRRRDTLIDIEPRAFELLVYLLEHRDRAVGKDELQNEVWGTIVSDSAMTRSVMKLRKSLGDSSESIIKTVPRFGYRFVAEISAAPEITAEEAATHHRAIAVGVSIAVALVLILTVVMLQKPAIVDKSVAVLPFADLSEAQDQQWFADGLAEEILNSIARTPDLFVSGRTSSFSYGNSNKDISTIAGELGVAHVLEGSVRRDGERLRVTAQLIRAADGFHIWSENFDHEYADLITIQEAVAIEIARALETTMDAERLALFVSSGTASVPAFEAYLKGLADYDAMLETGNVDTYTGSIESYQRAVELDPEFGRAWYEIAQFWSAQLSLTGILSGRVDAPREELRRRYEEAMSKAIQYVVDPTTKLNYRTSQAHFDMDFHKALALNSEFLALQPNNFHARDRQKILLSKLNRYDDLLHYVGDVFELDKRSVVSIARTLLTVALSGDRDAAQSYAEASVEVVGTNAIGLYQLHRAFLWSGNIAQAREVYVLLASSDMPEENLYLAQLRQLCAEGKVEQATALYTQRFEQVDDDLTIRWLAYTIFGDHEAAIDLWRPFDEQDLMQFDGVLQYSTFDPAEYPRLSLFLSEHGEEPGPVLKIPYRCTN